MSPSLTATLTGHGGAVNAVAFSPAGRLLASAGSDWQVIAWDAAEPVRPVKLATLAHSRPDRAELPPIWLRGMLGRSPDSPANPGVKAVGFSPDGQVLASGSISGTVLLWQVTDPAHPRVLATGSGHTDENGPAGAVILAAVSRMAVPRITVSAADSALTGGRSSPHHLL